jgi:fructokinase
MPIITSIGEILFDVYDNDKKLGGAPFNFIYHVIKLSGNGNFISRIGNDENGKEILDFFENKKISPEFIQIDTEHPTGKATANLNENKVPNWVIEENCAYDFIKAQSNVDDLIAGSDCLYFGTLAQRNTVSRETIQSLFSKKVKFFCDLNIRQKFYTKDTIEFSLKTSNVLKINEDELILLSELYLFEKYDLEKSALKLKELFNIDMICVTKGESGSYLFRADEVNYCKASVEKPVDTVGAGDAFAAILCVGYLNKVSLDELNKTANDFAGEIVRVTGALPTGDGIYRKFKSAITK